MRDPACKAIVLTGHGRFFMAGADIQNLRKNAIAVQKSGASTESMFSFFREGHSLMEKMENGSKPVVAAVNGPAFGGGLEVERARTHTHSIRPYLVHRTWYTVLGTHK